MAIQPGIDQPGISSRGHLIERLARGKHGESHTDTDADLVFDRVADQIEAVPHLLEVDSAHPTYELIAAVAHHRIE